MGDEGMRIELSGGDAIPTRAQSHERSRREGSGPPAGLQRHRHERRASVRAGQRSHTAATNAMVIAGLSNWGAQARCGSVTRWNSTADPAHPDAPSGPHV